MSVEKGRMQVRIKRVSVEIQKASVEIQKVQVGMKKVSVENLVTSLSYKVMLLSTCGFSSLRKACILLLNFASLETQKELRPVSIETGRMRVRIKRASVEIQKASVEIKKVQVGIQKGRVESGKNLFGKVEDVNWGISPLTFIMDLR